MKKVIFYINAIHHGGAERVICNLATQFSEHGYESVLVTSFKEEWEYSYGGKVRRISLFENKLNCGKLKRNFLLVKKLRKLIKTEQPDVVVSFMAEPNFRAIMASRGLKNKVVVSVRNDPNKEYSGFIMRILAKRLFRKADGVVFQTEDAQKWFPKSIQKKSKIIFNQVDEVFYNTKYDGERRDIVTTGRLVSQKNHKLLIRAFAEIADKIPDNLIIYGEGELRTELEKMIAELGMQDRIFLPGSVKDVAETIKSAKLFVLSSGYEGMPNSLMEAMALGIPCISTDCPCGGPRMLFGNDSGGVLFDTGDSERLAEILLELMVDGVKRDLLSRKAQGRAKMFLPQNIFDCWQKYIDDIVLEKDENVL